MISPDAAMRRVLRHARPLGAVRVDLDDALGCVLAEDVTARYPLPAFDNSAMDGYAVASAVLRRAAPGAPVRLKVVKGVYAGDSARRALARGTACAIMTGAPLPRGADAVIPVERASVDADTLVVAERVERGRHIRRRGEEVRKGARVARRGALVHPGTVSCIAAAGRGRVRVVRRPLVTVISTGDETVAPGRALAHGRIYDSNSHMLVALLRASGIDGVHVARVADRPAAVDRALADALAASDVVVVTGGVSVGERDFVRAGLEQRGVREVFWRVRQKPGKPLYFGVRGKTLVFGLPGNPASAFTCFCLYVYPALRRLAGLGAFTVPVDECVLVHPVSPDASRWSFLKAMASSARPDGVEILPRQGSHMITSLAVTGRLVAIPPGREMLGVGTRVRAYRLPYAGGLV